VAASLPPAAATTVAAAAAAGVAPVATATKLGLSSGTVSLLEKLGSLVAEEAERVRLESRLNAVESRLRGLELR